MCTRKIVVFTGAGISVESGLKAFRGSDGLWENYRIEDVATPEAWQQQPQLVQRFYNERRKACRIAQPNVAHRYFAALEEKYNIRIITQNIDDLHERAGSTHVLHLHGEIIKSQSSQDPTRVYPIEGDVLDMDARCDLGTPLRPHVVWFGEPVPMMYKAIPVVQQADVFIIVGTSLQVYPAADLVNYVKSSCQVVLVDPQAYSGPLRPGTIHIAKPATLATRELSTILAK